MKPLDVVLPCRVTGTRLYGKPLQLIDIQNNITILENLVRYIMDTGIFGRICLAISEEEENHGFIRLAKAKDWDYITGSPHDVLGRVNKATEFLQCEHIGFASTENPFIFTEQLPQIYERHVKENLDFSMQSDLPDGAAFSILKTEALRISHRDGTDRHRSELVTSYVFDNKEKFKMNNMAPPEELRRSNIRLTVDYPEDLIFCRQVYMSLKGYERLIPLREIVQFWDTHPVLRKPLETIGIDWGHGRLWD